MCPRWAAKMGLARTSPCWEHRDAIATGWSPAAVCVARGVQSCYREVAPLQNNKKIPPKLPKRQGSCGEDGRYRVSPWAGYTSPAAFSCTLYSLLLFTFQPMRARSTVPTTLYPTCSPRYLLREEDGDVLSGGGPPAVHGAVPA